MYIYKCIHSPAYITSQRVTSRSWFSPSPMSRQGLSFISIFWSVLLSLPPISMGR